MSGDSLEVSLDTLGDAWVPWEVPGCLVWSLGGPWGFLGSPNRFVMYIVGFSSVSEGSLGGHNFSKGRQRISSRSTTGVSYGVSGRSPHCLAEAKSDGNKRRLRIGDLTRPGCKVLAS